MGSLFKSLVEDLLGQIEFYGAGLRDVVIDGVLCREDGGYITPRTAFGTLEAASPGEVPRPARPMVSDDATQGVVLRRSCSVPESLPRATRCVSKARSLFVGFRALHPRRRSLVPGQIVQAHKEIKTSPLIPCSHQP